jgi:RNA polymerase sigma-70 factor (ECF subfamily)
MAEFHDRYAARVRGILWGVLGPDHELSDLHHDVFVRALGSIHSLKEVNALQSWMSAVAVHTAKAALEKRLSRRRWLAPLSSKPVPEPASPDPSGRLDAREALRAIHTLLDRLPVAERIAFGLRFLDGFELVDVAEACEVSLATIKRRLARAEQRFTALAQSSPVLMELLQKGSPKWTRR